MNNNLKTYLHISAGRGPAECCWVVAKTYLAFNKYCKNEGISIDIEEKQDGPKANTFYSILVVINSSNTKKLNKIRNWEGTIQWIGQSPYRAKHKRKNWFIGLSIIEMKVNENIGLDDLVYKTYRASGPGGQHRNKVETAVRVTHVKTGISTTSSDSKSQLRNKLNAIKKLKMIFDDQHLIYQKELVEDMWKGHQSLERGNAVKVYIGAKFKER